MKIQNRVACLVLGLVGLFGTAASAVAQPTQNYVFGTFKGWKCSSVGRVELKLVLKNNKTQFFPTNKTCEVNGKEINRLFGGQGRNTYVRNDRDQITHKAVW